jgi:hypothetical protein
MGVNVGGGVEVMVEVGGAVFVGDPGGDVGDGVSVFVGIGVRVFVGVEVRVNVGVGVFVGGTGVDVGVDVGNAGWLAGSLGFVTRSGFPGAGCPELQVPLGS